MQGQYPGDRSGTFTFNDANLSGTPTWTVSSGVVPGTRRFYSQMPIPISAFDPGSAPGLTLHLDAGDAVSFAINQDWYYQNYDGLTQGFWMIRKSGAGTLVVADSFDVDYWWPDPNPAGALVYSPCAEKGTDGECTYYAADPVLLDKGHLQDDGYAVVSLECTSGTVDIDYIGLRVNQPQGFFDAVLDESYEFVTTWSVTQPESEREPLYTLTDTYAITIVDGETVWAIDGTPLLHPVADEDSDYGTKWVGSGSSLFSAEAALDGANADFHAVGGPMGPDAVVSLQYTPAHGDILGPVPQHWDAQVQENVSFQTAPTMSTLYDVTPEGLAEKAGWEAVGFEWMDDNTEFKGWVIFGIDTYYDTQNYVFTQGDGDVVRYSAILSATGGEDLHSEWFDPGTGIEIISGETTDTFGGSVDPGGIPDGPFLLALDSAGYYIPTTDRLIYLRLELERRFEPDTLNQFTTWNGYSGGNEGTVAGLTSRRFSDDSSLGAGRVAARYRVPMWRWKIPIYEYGWNLATGQLKVWLPSAEWRIIGNEAGSATERQKIQTPDLTWWQEYRTVDGDVPTHPLKLYTAGGWIIAARFTPD